eukprot:PhF_6_TR5590/c0_g1_i1/m.8027/K04739/PRKAR; cAMP-dependent protein kinase regulator
MGGAQGKEGSGAHMATQPASTTARAAPMKTPVPSKGTAVDKEKVMTQLTSQPHNPLAPPKVSNTQTLHANNAVTPAPQKPNAPAGTPQSNHHHSPATHTSTSNTSASNQPPTTTSAASAQQQQQQSGSGGNASSNASQDPMTVLRGLIGEKPTLKVCLRLAVSMGKEQREAVGKFRKDERHTCMELYETLGLEDDEMFGPPNEFQKQLRKFNFPPPNMHLLRDVDKIDAPTMDYILGNDEAQRRRSADPSAYAYLSAVTQTSDSSSSEHGGVTRRQGVSSESANMKTVLSSAYKVIPKNKEQTTVLTAAMKNCMLFSSLDSRDQKILFDAFEMEVFNPQEIVFELGDEGDKFYLVAQGQVKIELPTGVVIELKDGGTFGELGVMYGTPRAATVTAVTPTALWSMDRDTYRSILMRQMLNKRDVHMKFLNSVPILSSMDAYEKARISDVLDSRVIEPKTIVMNEGENGDCMYFLEEGVVSVLKGGKEVSRIEPGGYFGELALLFDSPRKATIVADSRCRVLCLSRFDFSHILGPLESILRRNLNQYEQYMSELNKR